jgi:hypothetical protein
MRKGKGRIPEKLSKLFTRKQGHLTRLGISYARSKDLPSRLQKRADGHLAACGKCCRGLQRMNRIVDFVRSVFLSNMTSYPRPRVKAGGSRRGT